MKNINIQRDLTSLSRAAAQEFINIGNKAIKNSERFTVVLSGGSTPKSLYQMLAAEEFKTQIDWTKVFFFFGDERDVSPASDQSNFKTANETLLKHLEIPKTNIFRWQTEIINVVEVAAQYGQRIQKFFGLKAEEFPRFDLILLGMGDDGHMASLFPHSKALAENKRIAVANPVKKLNTTRLTFTFPVINNASNIIFLVSGENKAKTLQKVLEGEFQPDKFPSQAVKPSNGNLLWIVDEEAAELLENN